MVLLRHLLAAEEQTRLRIMIGKGFRADAELAALQRLCKRAEAGRGFAGALRRETVGVVIDAAFWHLHLHMSVALIVGERAFRCIYRDLVKIWSAKPLELGVEIGKHTPL